MDFLVKSVTACLFCFQKFELKKTITEEIDIDDVPMEEDLPRGDDDDDDDLDEYSFSKFASMYFQGAATHTHIRQRLLLPLLYHEDQGDVLVLTSDYINSSFLWFLYEERLCWPSTYHCVPVMLPSGVHDSVVDHPEVFGRPP